VAEGNPAVLVLLCDREREAKVRSNQLRAGIVPHVVRRRATHRSRELFLLKRSEHWLPAQLLDVKVQQIAIIVRHIHRFRSRRSRAPDPMFFRNASVVSMPSSSSSTSVQARFATSAFGLIRRAPGWAADTDGTAVLRLNSAMYSSNT